MKIFHTLPIHPNAGFRRIRLIPITILCFVAAFGPQEKKLTFDMFRTVDKNLPPQPIAVFAHGGSFKTGKKDKAYTLCEVFARRGYVAVSIEYRLLPDLPHPEEGDLAFGRKEDVAINAAIEDGAKAVRYLHPNAGKYNIDPDRILIGGISAGAGLGMGVGYLEAEQIGPDAKVRAVLNICGGGILGNGQVVDDNDPPTYFVHGTADPIVDIQGLYDTLKTFDKVGITYEAMVIEGMKHGSPQQDLEIAWLKKRAYTTTCLHSFSGNWSSQMSWTQNGQDS